VLLGVFVLSSHVSLVFAISCSVVPLAFHFVCLGVLGTLDVLLFVGLGDGNFVDAFFSLDLVEATTSGAVLMELYSLDL
jgi:hypothetical protein